ncbi:MAG TPA: M57 family metalloprotease [Chitinophagaceae bacterium]|nr:M57 family metalloprotease [Chitinophagaceae bacterium]
MKRLFLLAGLCYLASCSKQDNVATTDPEKNVCDFGIRDFNLTKRAPVEDEFNNRKPKNQGGGSGGGGTISPTAGVVWLDFDGDVVSNTVWNTSGPIYCAPANLSATDVNTVINHVSNDFSPFNITITTDEAVFNAAPTTRRQKVIITESWEWFGQAGGVSFNGSFSSGTYTPCFVFSSLLSYNIKKIAEAISHETGHTMGLRHQSTYDANCVKTNEYNYGQGSGETGWAPIMGIAYYQNLSLWHRGPNTLGCTTIQDDAAVIAALVGYKTDDHGNSTSNASTLSTAAAGTINTTADVDMFSVNISTTRTLNLVPFNVNVNNTAANIDMVLRIYNSQGTLLQTIDNPSSLAASASLAPGTYFVSAGNIANPNTSTYGMIGKYVISLD